MTPGRGSVGLAMLGHLVYPRWDAAPMSRSPVAVEGLRREIGFRGVVMTDDLGMRPRAEMDPFNVLARAVAVAVNLLLNLSALAPPSGLMAYLSPRVADGAVAEARVKSSARRVLRLKAGHT